MKARGALEQADVEVEMSVDARKDVIQSDAAWGLFREMETLYVGKGRKIVIYQPDPDGREEILKACLGRTGNLRAPVLRVGRYMYVGYNDALYEELLG